MHFTLAIVFALAAIATAAPRKPYDDPSCGKLPSLSIHTAHKTFTVHTGMYRRSLPAAENESNGKFFPFVHASRSLISTQDLFCHASIQRGWKSVIASGIRGSRGESRRHNLSIESTIMFRSHRTLQFIAHIGVLIILLSMPGWNYLTLNLVE
jgi:hypothetical protein